MDLPWVVRAGVEKRWARVRTELAFVYEGHPGFAVFPTFPIRWGGAGAPLTGGLGCRSSAGGVGVAKRLRIGGTRGGIAGMDRESTLFLLEKGVKVVGIDAWSWDRPLSFMAKEFQETGDPKVIWEAHFRGLKSGIVTWKRWPICQPLVGPMASQFVVFPLRSKGPVQVGRVPWLSWKRRD